LVDARKILIAKRFQDNREPHLIPRQGLESGEQTIEAPHRISFLVSGPLLFLQSADREECEKSKQLKNDQNRSDYRDHVFVCLGSGSENI
jgi:hypothetical protein